MGKGDKRTEKGKRFKASYGVSRLKKKKTKTKGKSTTKVATGTTATKKK